MSDPRPSAKNPQALPWMPMWTQDILSDLGLAMASPEEQAAFFYALCAAWQMDGLPPDLSRLRSVLPISETEAVRAFLEERFPVAEDGLRRNPDQERQRAAQISKRRAGKLGADSRWDGKADGKQHGKADGKQHGSKRLRGIEAKKPRTKKPKPPADEQRVEGVHEQVVAYWSLRWEETRQSPWAWQAKDFAALKAVRKLAEGDLGEIQGRMDRLLEHPRSWFRENASPTLLRSKWNELSRDVSRNGGRQKGDWLKDLEFDS